MNINNLAIMINGKIIGFDDYFNKDGFIGNFTFLNEAKEGDIVIRHRVNGKGIEMAVSKNVACFITLNPTDDAITKAKELHFPLIICEKIEIATAFALKWVVDKYFKEAKSIVITGTNGKSTTSHMIYHILNQAGFKVFTNTDSRSEFNTLCDPVVSKLLFDQFHQKGTLDFLVIEVSEVQGWLGALMKKHAYVMANALNPICGVITNVTLDHIGLVNSIDEVYNEICEMPNAINEGSLVLNYDDNLVKKIGDNLNDNIKSFFFSMNPIENSKKTVYYDENSECIFVNGKSILKKNELPFNTNHFIQNILSAITACLAINIDVDDIIRGVKSYKSLNRRFVKLNDKPLIYDDFAHNPDGIRNTIKESIKLIPENGELYIICSIRGSRGIEINKFNVEAISEVINNDIKLILSSSNDVVDNLNYVSDEEREVFFEVLNENGINYVHYDNLYDALETTYNKANDNDIILLIGAQGMDPAEDLLKEIMVKK